jgi:hypothetical protein
LLFACCEYRVSITGDDLVNWVGLNSCVPRVTRCQCCWNACLFRFICFVFITSSRPFDQGLISPMVTATIMSSIEYLEGIPVSSESQVDRVHLLQPRRPRDDCHFVCLSFCCPRRTMAKQLPIAKAAVSDMFDNLDRSRRRCHDASQHIEENHQVGRFFRTLRKSDLRLSWILTYLHVLPDSRSRPSHGPAGRSANGAEFSRNTTRPPIQRESEWAITSAKLAERIRMGRTIRRKIAGVIRSSIQRDINCFFFFFL